MFEEGAKVPLSHGTVLDPIQDSDIVAIWQRAVAKPPPQAKPSAEGPRAESFDSRELNLQIPSEPVDNAAPTPQSSVLSPQSQIAGSGPAYRPIEEDEPRFTAKAACTWAALIRPFSPAGIPWSRRGAGGFQKCRLSHYSAYSLSRNVAYGRMRQRITAVRARQPDAVYSGD